MINGKKFYLILFIVAKVEVLLATNFTFAELIRLRKGCHVFGDCQAKFPLGCSCLDDCVEYGDCCLTASAYNGQRVMDTIHKYECIQVGPIAPHTYYMMGKCSDSEKNEDIKKLCFGATPHYGARKSRRSPFFHTPVTSSINNVTYSNYYCAICNNESIANLHMWNAKLESHKFIEYNESYVWQNVRLNENGSWGFDTKGSGFQQLDIIFDKPTLKNNAIRRCNLSINKCSPNWEDQYTENLCNSYSTIVYANGTPYRNYHCAICNFVNESDLSCPISLKTGYSPQPFYVLFQFSSPKEFCVPGSIWDNFTQQCRQVVCLKENEKFVNGKCAGESKATVGGLLHSSPVPKASINSTRNITSCDKVVIKTTEYVIDANLTIFINSSQQIYMLGEYEMHRDGITVCLHQNNLTYSSALSWISFSGLSLSIVCLTLHLIIFTIVPELRNLSGKNLASLCVALMIAYLCFIITSFLEWSQGGCHALAAVMYYFFLASFTWMNVMAFDVWSALYLATSQLRVANGKGLKRFIYYSVYAWTLPLIATVIVIVIDSSKPSQLAPSLLPELGERHCWFGQRNALLIFFALPLTLIMTANTIFFVVTIKATTKSKSTIELGKVEPYQVQIKLYFKLAVLMGLGWISGIVAGFLQNEFVWYLFVIMNTFQGLYILMAYTCTKRVRDSLSEQNSKLFKSSNNVSLQDSNSDHKSQLTSMASTILSTMLRKISNTSTEMQFVECDRL